MHDSADHAAPEIGAAAVLDKAEAWRLSEFLRLGLDDLTATAAAVERNLAVGGYAIDLGEFRAFVAAGCAPHVAYRILS